MQPACQGQRGEQADALSPALRPCFAPAQPAPAAPSAGRPGCHAVGKRLAAGRRALPGGLPGGGGPPHAPRSAHALPAARPILPLPGKWAVPQPCSLPGLKAGEDCAAPAACEKESILPQVHLTALPVEPGPPPYAHFPPTRSQLPTPRLHLPTCPARSSSRWRGSPEGSGTPSTLQTCTAPAELR